MRKNICNIFVCGGVGYENCSNWCYWACWLSYVHRVGAATRQRV